MFIWNCNQTHKMAACLFRNIPSIPLSQQPLINKYDRTQAAAIHYINVKMGAMASRITGASMVCSTVWSAADQRKHLSSAWLADVRGIKRWPANSPHNTHKWPVTRKMFPSDDVIMKHDKANRTKTRMDCINMQHVTTTMHNVRVLSLFVAGCYTLILPIIENPITGISTIMAIMWVPSKVYTIFWLMRRLGMFTWIFTHRWLFQTHFLQWKYSYIEFRKNSSMWFSWRLTSTGYRNWYQDWGHCDVTNDRGSSPQPEGEARGLWWASQVVGDTTMTEIEVSISILSWCPKAY